MPELPEVQTTASGLDRRIRGLLISDVWTDYDSPFHKGKDSIKDKEYFARFRKQVTGAIVKSVGRKAKNVLIYIDKGGKESAILIHMKMTGHIMYGRYAHGSGPGGGWAPEPGERASLSDPYNRFIHFVISFSNGKKAVLSDTRKFAKVTLISKDEMRSSAHLRGIGPDPLDRGFAYPAFRDRLSLRPNARIKQALMDQSLIAGIGNIYSDEALWRAGIHPEERVRSISPLQMRSLFKATIAVLRKGMDFGGDSMSDYRNVDGERGEFQDHHRAYRRTGQACSKPGCRGIIRRKLVGGRSAHFCDEHQRLKGEAR